MIKKKLFTSKSRLRLVTHLPQCHTVRVEAGLAWAAFVTVALSSRDALHCASWPKYHERDRGG